MLKRSFVSAAFLFIIGCVPAFAQSSGASHVEISGFAGWVFSDGVSGDNTVAGDGAIYDRVDPKDSASFGFSLGVLAGENAEVGFMYGRQPSTLVLGGTSDKELGDLAITTYHGYFGYNFGPADSAVRPFLYGGLGATNFGSVGVTFLGQPHDIPSQTQFSTTWGGGVKIYPAPHFGIRLAGRWTPTYIKTDAGGWWCDPYWGCYLVGNAQYANQVELSGGVTVRF